MEADPHLHALCQAMGRKSALHLASALPLPSPPSSSSLLRLASLHAALPSHPASASFPPHSPRQYRLLPPAWPSPLRLLSPVPLPLRPPLRRLSLPLPPPLLIHSPLSAALTTSSSHFLIVALGTPAAAALNPVPSLPPFVAEMYSSATSSWTPLPSLPQLRNPTLIPRSSASVVWWKELFCMLWGNRILTFKPSCAGTEADLQTWGSIELPKEPRIWDARFLTLHVSKERLFVEGNFQEQGDFQRRHPLRIGVMEFDPTNWLWKEASFMPDSLSTRLCRGQQHPAHCFYTTYSDTLSDVIYFTPFVGQDCDCERAPDTGMEIVLFDVAGSGSWSSISNVSASFSCPTFKGLTFHVSC